MSLSLSEASVPPLLRSHSILNTKRKMQRLISLSFPRSLRPPRCWSYSCKRSYHAILAWHSSLTSIRLNSWDKDLLGKEYLGEVSVSIEEWFKEGAVSFEDPKNMVRASCPRQFSSFHRSHKHGCLCSLSRSVSCPPGQKPRYRVPSKSSLGLSNLQLPPMDDLSKKSTQILSVDLYKQPPLCCPHHQYVHRAYIAGLAFSSHVIIQLQTRGIGTVRSRIGPPTEEPDDESDLEDDGMSSDDEGGETDDDFFDAEGTGPEAPSGFPPSASSATALGAEAAPLPTIIASPGIMPASDTPAAVPSRSRLPRMFSSRSSAKSQKGSPATPAELSLGSDYLAAKPVRESSSRSGSLTPGGTRIRRPKFRKRPTSGYNLDVSQDITGIVLLEIAGATDLPKFRNCTPAAYTIYRTRLIILSLG